MKNLYIRYFDTETVVTTYEDAIKFLESLPEVKVDKFLRDDLYTYYTSDMPYPKRYKTRQRSYFIVIKTLATTLKEFKDNAHKGEKKETPKLSEKDYQMEMLNRQRPGWYEASIMFRRVLPTRSGKCKYRDTDFVVRLKGMSKMDCYKRVIDHLTARRTIDRRSQFPSVKSRHFACKYLGMEIK